MPTNTGATIVRKVATLRRLFAFTRAENYLDADPFATGEVILPPAQSPGPASPPPTEAQVRRLLAAPDAALAKAGHPFKGAAAFRDKTLLALTALQGVQPIELHHLDLDDYQPEARRGKGVLRLNGAKGRQRTITLLPETKALLDLWLRARALLHPDTPAIFLNLHTAQGSSAGPAHQRLGRRSIQDILCKHLRAAGLDGHTPRAVRQSFRPDLDLDGVFNALAEMSQAHP